MTDDGWPDDYSTGRVNLVDVALRAGVSSSTASRSLRGLPKVAPETRQRVLDAARDLQYRATTQPRDPVPARKLVAIIVPYINSWYFSTVTAGAIDVLRTQGHDVLLYHLGNAAVRDEFFEKMPLDELVDGILSLSMPLTDSHTLALRAMGKPLVSVGSVVAGATSVGIDEVAAAATAVNHLINLRHERIGCLLGESDDPRFGFETTEARYFGYERAMTAAHLPVADELVAHGPHTFEGGAQAMTDLLSRPTLPTAVFAESDDLAVGALWALRRAGMRVPEDISIVGIDDHEMAPMFELTTVSQNVRQQGQVAAGCLVEQLNPGSDSSQVDRRLIIPTRLILRRTTTPLRSARSTRGGSASDQTQQSSSRSPA